MGAAGHSPQGSSSSGGTALASDDDGEGTNIVREGGTEGGEGSLRLLLSRSAEASQNARKPSSSPVKARVRGILCSPRIDGASTRG